MIKKFENFDEELLDATTLIQILEQIYDELDYEITANKKI